MHIDLRSDTITLPTEGMRRAMADAEVGDDVFREDPTVIRLEERIAVLMGKEAALFVPSGHMGNQVCLQAHSRPGDAVIGHELSHIFQYESGSVYSISGLAPHFIRTADGVFGPDEVRSCLMPKDIHKPRNRLLSLENTHNRCGGVVWPIDWFREVCGFAHGEGLKVHLDGARLWNACIATGTAPADWAAHVDSLSVCFSKGLGAPVGSAVAGSRDLIDECRFLRKVHGGQMRQAGIIAAGALYALDNHYERLAGDHANARAFAEAAGQARGLKCVEPMSNIVMINVTADGISAQEVADGVAAEGVHLFALAGRMLRAVTHLNVTREQCITAGEVFVRVMDRLTNQQ